MGERMLRGRRERPAGRATHRGSGGIPAPSPAWDDASAVLPPTDDEPEVPDERDDGLWHTATVASGPRTGSPRRRLSLALGALAAATLLVSGYAAVQLAGIVGLLPPSPPKYVLQDQDVRAADARHRAARPIVVTFGPGFAVHHAAPGVTALLELVRREKAQFGNGPVAPARVAPVARAAHNGSRDRDRDSDDESDRDSDDDDSDDDDDDEDEDD